MEFSELELIVKAVTGTIGGATGLLMIIKGILAIVNIVANVKKAKANRLNDGEKQDLLRIFKDSLIGGVTLDMDAQLNRATNNRFIAIEQQNNEIANKIETIEKTTKLLAEGMSQFKTISSDIKNKLYDNCIEASNEIKKLDVVESGVIEIKEEKAEKIGY